VEGSIEMLINNMVSSVQGADPNNQRLQTLLATLEANDARLAALVTQNTPAQTDTPVPPPAPQ
jgi:hypothetical protein